MRISRPVGILSYGTYLPAFVVSGEEIERAQSKVGENLAGSLGVSQKTVPNQDEDTATFSVAAAFQATQRWAGSQADIGALFIGSESHPYAVKPTGTMVHRALGLSEDMALADLQFACKAGTQSLQVGTAYVLSEMAKVALAIGADTAQGRPGDVLEFTAGAGAAAYLIGQENILVKILATASVASDTPDFWRRPGQAYPEHAGRFTGGPGYFHHIALATQKILAETQLTPDQLDYCVFHTPNGKFPVTVAHQLGFTPKQLAPSLVVKNIGNTYAAASLLALAAVLDQAPAGAKVLMTSYGSGSGADCFLLETTPLLVQKRKSWRNLVQDQIERTNPISYQTYRRYTETTQQL